MPILKIILLGILLLCLVATLGDLSKSVLNDKNLGGIVVMGIVALALLIAIVLIAIFA
jgi:hypothetical protein